MLKKSILLISILIISLNVIVLISQGDGKEVSKSETELNKIYNKFEYQVLKSFYSIEELRPYSIIQLDKTSDMYNNEWISPKTIVDALNDKEKLKIKNSIADFLNTVDGEQKKYLLRKIKFWCLADLQMSMLNTAFGYAKEDLLQAVYNLDKTKDIFFKLQPQGVKKLDGLSELQFDEAYNEAINVISGLEFKDQLEYYSDLYRQLSHFAMK